MPAPSAREIYEAAETAILELMLDGKASATFLGKGYTALSLDQLRKVRDEYRQLAIARGELVDNNTASQAVRVSYAEVKEL